MNVYNFTRKYKKVNYSKIFWPLKKRQKVG